MKKDTAARISEYLNNREAEPGSRFTVERFRRTKPLNGFHQWADAKPLVSADHIRRDDRMAFDCLLIDWKESGEWYVVVCEQSTHAPLAEIWSESTDGDVITLAWQYKPAKRDGRNAERVAYFRQHVGDRTLQISVPKPDEDSVRFIEDLFDLVDNRLRADELSADEPDVREGFPEGEEFERRHVARERNPTLIRLAKARALQRGELVCQICSFDFGRTYGRVGYNYIEGHHTIPVKDLRKGDQTRVEDIALVCSNCHRMLHRRRPWLTMEELRVVLATQPFTPRLSHKPGPS
jgi:hypothetical protein